MKGFAKTSDHRLSFTYRGLKVHIDIMKGRVPFSDPPVVLPKPTNIDYMLIDPKDYPLRALKTKSESWKVHHGANPS